MICWVTLNGCEDLFGSCHQYFTQFKHDLAGQKLVSLYQIEIESLILRRFVREISLFTFQVREALVRGATSALLWLLASFSQRVNTKRAFNDGFVAFHYKSYEAFFIYKKLYPLRGGFTHYRNDRAK